jgi:hypothetical protein|tara:strand:- start:310 stop:711 length:402 start_codon:yes stop_codon:yes gene_type:complete
VWSFLLEEKMDAWIIIGVFFLGVFSYRLLSTALNYTHSYNFLTYCLASCLTLIKSFGKDVVTVRDRLNKHMIELDIPEEERKALEKTMETTLNNWQSVTFIRVVAVIPKEFSKVLKTDEICGKLKDAFDEVNK